MVSTPNRTASRDHTNPGRRPRPEAYVLRGPDVLLIRRAKPPQSDRWSIPGGAQEIGETVRAAALREVAEETGLAVEIVGLVDGITRDAGGRARYHYTLVDFAARWVAGEACAGKKKGRLAPPFESVSGAGGAGPEKASVARTER